MKSRNANGTNSRRATIRGAGLLFAAAGVLAGCASTPRPFPAATVESELAAAAAYQFHSPAALTAETTISEATEWTGPQIDTATAAFLNFDRSTANRSDLVELKFGFLHWRSVGTQTLVSRLLNAASLSEASDLLSRLQELDAALAPDQLVQIGDRMAQLLSASVATDSSGGVIAVAEVETRFSKLLALQADHDVTIRVLRSIPSNFRVTVAPGADGPPIVPRIKASRESNWQTGRILSTPDLTTYPRDKDGFVHLRGISFHPGDVFLVNLYNPSEGVFTDFSEPENYSYHVALYVEIRSGGMSYPCVYESYEHGTRIVPLVSYLNPSHLVYLEVYRWNSSPPDYANRLSAAVLAELKRPHGFNIYIDQAHSRSGQYVTCTTTIGNVLETAGYSLPDALTPISEKTQANLSSLGINEVSYFSPTDYAVDPALSPVGFVDNDHWQLYVAAEMANTRLNDDVKSETLRPETDGTYRTYHTFAGIVLNHTFLLAPTIRGLFGFNRENFPIGPAAGLAFVLRAEDELDAQVPKIDAQLTANPGFYQRPGWFSIHAANDSRAMRAEVGDELTNVDSWFVPD